MDVESKKTGQRTGKIGVFRVTTTVLSTQYHTPELMYG